MIDAVSQSRLTSATVQLNEALVVFCTNHLDFFVLVGSEMLSGSPKSSGQSFWLNVENCSWLPSRRYKVVLVVAVSFARAGLH
jgi:hypothetical protein